MAHPVPIAPHVQGLLFDCDGTLVDSMPLHMEAWSHAFTRAGHDCPLAFIDRLKGMDEEAIVALYNDRHGAFLDPATLVGEKHRYFFERLHQIHIIEPVVRLVREHAGRLPLAVVSGGRRRTVEAELEATGLISFFPVRLTADDGLPPKPAPDLFLEAARRIGVAPSACHVFEDGDLGLEAAQKAGMTATDVRPLLVSIDVTP